ncbi:MAG: hypothetical protein HON94_02650 [Methylococcales bacterium]|jgi:hypothetical protein|nr:hypothetical protein [Methylococcales bacterium]MBT7409803.1 hypothetical protein [Methylococcales bacterium]
MKTILEKYLNKEIGINIEHAFRFESAQIIAVEETYFSVKDENQSYIHHFSHRSIVQIIENDDGINIGGFLSHKHFSMVIKVGHIFEYIPV